MCGFSAHGTEKIGGRQGRRVKPRSLTQKSRSAAPSLKKKKPRRRKDMERHHRTVPSGMRKTKGPNSETWDKGTTREGKPQGRRDRAVGGGGIGALIPLGRKIVVDPSKRRPSVSGVWISRKNAGGETAGGKLKNSATSEKKMS